MWEKSSIPGLYPVSTDTVGLELLVTGKGQVGSHPTRTYRAGRAFEPECRQQRWSVTSPPTRRRNRNGKTEVEMKSTLPRYEREAVCTAHGYGDGRELVDKECPAAGLSMRPRFCTSSIRIVLETP